MTRDEAISLADQVLALVNSRPSTPTRDEIARLIGWDGLSIEKLIEAGAIAPITRVKALDLLRGGLITAEFDLCDSVCFTKIEACIDDLKSDTEIVVTVSSK